MSRHDWIVSIYAGAAWGGIFWAGLLMVTSLRGWGSPPHAALITIGVAIIVGIAGMALFRSTGRRRLQRIGAAIGIGALIGLPVLAWVALW
jgi:hypothetical protein